MHKAVLLLIALICSLSLASVTMKSKARTLGPEKVVLDIEYLGTCADFVNNDYPSVRVSRHSSQECLPIRFSSPSPLAATSAFVDPDLFSPDNNDLHSDYFCTDKEGKRAFIHFVEIYDDSNVETSDWVISFVPSAPFRVVNTESSVYTRRPDCTTLKTFCGTRQRVTNCTVNSVELATIMNKRNNFLTDAFVISKDRIYINMKENGPALCNLNGACCPYIAPSSNATNPGYCPYAATQVIMDFIDDVEDHSTIYDFLEEEDLIDRQHGLKKGKRPHKKPSHKRPTHKKPTHKKPAHKKPSKKPSKKPAYKKPQIQEEQRNQKPLEGTEQKPVAEAPKEEVDPESITTPEQDKIFELNIQKLGNVYKDKHGVHKINHIGGKKTEAAHADNETRQVAPVIPVKKEETMPLIPLKK